MLTVLPRAESGGQEELCNGLQLDHVCEMQSCESRRVVSIVETIEEGCHLICMMKICIVPAASSDMKKSSGS